MKGNKLNMNWFKDQVKNTMIGGNNEDARAEIIKGFDTCGKDGNTKKYKILEF